MDKIGWQGCQPWKKGSLLPSLLQHPFLQKAFVEKVIASQRRSNLLKLSANLKQIASGSCPRNDRSHANLCGLATINKNHNEGLNHQLPSF